MPLFWSFVGCKVRAHEAPDPSVDVPTTVTFSGKEFDTDNMWSATDPTRVRIRKAGHYLVIGAARWPAGDGVRGVAVKRNGGEWPAEARTSVTATQAMLQAVTVARLAQGDSIELETYFKGSAQDLPSLSDQALTVVRVG
jgi:hypothetical protein